jgi:hypothetical protein
MATKQSRRKSMFLQNPSVADLNLKPQQIKGNPFVFKIAPLPRTLINNTITFLYHKLQNIKPN